MIDVEKSLCFLIFVVDLGWYICMHGVWVTTQGADPNLGCYARHGFKPELLCMDTWNCIHVHGIWVAMQGMD